MIHGETARASYRLTVGSTAVAVVKSDYVGPMPDRAVLTIETASVRLRYDGVDPTTDEGHKLDAAQTARIEGNNNVAKARLIRDSATDAQVFVTLEAR